MYLTCVIPFHMHEMYCTVCQKEWTCWRLMFFSDKGKHNTTPDLMQDARKSRNLTVWVNLSTCTGAEPIWKRGDLSWAINYRRKKAFVSLCESKKSVKCFPKAVVRKSNCRRKIFASVSGLKSTVPAGHFSILGIASTLMLLNPPKFSYSSFVRCKKGCFSFTF